MRTPLTSYSGNRNTDGFALVVALVLMGFILVLALALGSLVQVEVQVSGQEGGRVEARQNALLGVSTAVGQLQKYAGPDQRVTATAALLEGTNSTVSNPHWVGVWRTAEDNGTASQLSRYTGGGQKNRTAIEDGALVWLVSGNEGDGNDYKPTVAVPQAEQIEIVGDGSVVRTDQRVTVPKVDVRDGTGQVIGRYAFWVSDEGVKGNIGYGREPRTGVPVAQLQNYPQKSGGRVLRTDAGEIIFANLDSKTEALSSLSQLALLSDVDKVDRELVHDVTLWSSGVLANVKDGGLRKDLADYRNLREGAMWEDPFPSPPQDNGATAPTTPRWQQIRSYLDLASRINVSGGQERIVPRPYFPSNNLPSAEDEAFQQGIYPVPVRLGTYVDAAFIQRGNGRYGIRLYFFPVIALWNPYDVAIAPARYSFSQYSDLGNANIRFSVGRWDGANKWEHKPMLKTGPNNTAVPDPAPEIYGINNSQFITGSGSNQNYIMHYSVDNSTGLAPGETKVFTATGLSPHARNADLQVLSEGFRPGEGFYRDLEPADSDFVSPYEFEIDAATADAITEWRIDLGVAHGSGATNEFLNEWWYFRNSAGQALMTLAGLNRAGLRNSMPIGSTNWDMDQDGRPRAFYPTVRTAGDSRAMPAGVIVGENAANSIDDFPAYGFLFELKQAFNDQNADTSIRRRRWLANFNPRAPKSQQINIGTGIGQVNQNYIGQLRARSDDLNDSQSDLYYSPLVFGANNERMYHGYSSRGGAERTILYHVPRPNVPLAGVGSLMHVNFAGYFRHAVGSVDPVNIIPAYVVGSSLADPHLQPRQLERHYTAWAENHRHFDYSYKVNELLWDAYFSSTDLFDGTGPRDPRFVSYPLAGAVPVYGDQETAHDTAAAKLMQTGTFNINSTSEKAWQMLLGATFGTSVQENGGDTRTIGDRAQFLRQGFAFGDVFTGTNESNRDAYEGLRALSRDEIEALSEEIVREVKERGPFYSLSHFVNRTIEAGAPNAHILKGALQAAIDATEINDAFSEEVTAGSATAQDPVTGYVNPAALYGSVGANVPGYLFQADLLAKIGNMLSARSDTFVIRGYGESLNPRGEVTARAYCEVVVQRVPDYVNPDADNSATYPPGDTSNREFGRRFEIKSFRWLDPESI